MEELLSGGIGDEDESILHQYMSVTGAFIISSIDGRVLSQVCNNPKAGQACRHGIRSGYRIRVACW